MPGAKAASAALGPLAQVQTTTGQLLIVVGVIAVCATIGIGVSVLWRRRPLISDQKKASETFFPVRSPTTPAAGSKKPRNTFSPPLPPDSTPAPALTRRLCAAFTAWLAEYEETDDLWTPFDQLLRETLGEALGAARVRCYHVKSGNDTLQPVALTGKGPGAAGPHAREGILGHAATTGKEYVAGDLTHGPLVDNLAAQTEETWTWVWPVRAGDATLGMVAVGSLHDPAALNGETRETVGRLVSLFWQHVVCRDQLRVARMTDRGSGVLTRADFFTLATQALAASYKQNEPVVLTALAIEGLRRLDDTGHWQERDTLVERIGQLIARRVRGDDLMGRFSDDRFVVLLRRLDSGLGRLIAEQLVSAASECLREADPTGERVRLRIGLAGSGFGQPPLQDMLVSAFEAIERARGANLTVATDLHEGGEQTSSSAPTPEGSQA
jgi:diguanylate cyclase (GGDEF)-like protein